MSQHPIFNLLVLPVAFAGLTFAAPLPVQLTGAPPKWIRLQTSGPNYHPVSNGGGFAGTVWSGYSTNAGGQPTGGTGPTFSTTMWCVDSQMFFSNGNQGLANINLLSSLPTSLVRYGTIDDANPGLGDGDPGWTNNFGSSVLNSAAARFRMAAWLVSHYSGFPAGPNANNGSNLNVQKAIWSIIHNSSPGADGPGWSSISGNVNTFGTIAYWVNQAKLNYNSVNAGKWAVVTWLVDKNGILLEDDRQTFLVQVVPEPGFHAMLALGMAGLIFAARRQKRA